MVKSGTSLPEVELSFLGTFIPWNFPSLELSFSTSKLAWNFHSLTLIIKPILYTIYDTLFNYSYAIGVNGTIVVFLVRPYN